MQQPQRQCRSCTQRGWRRECEQRRRRQRRGCPDGQRALDYDSASHRPSRAQVSREGVAGFDVDTAYSYDPAGNLLQVADRPSSGPADVQCFSYDYLRRLTGGWTPTAGCAGAPSVAGLGGPAPYWRSYAYDLTGNRTSEVSHTSAGDTSAAYSYPAAGSARPHGLGRVDRTGPGAGSDTFGYDMAGNSTSRAVAGRAAQALAYDPEGHLAAVSDTAGSTGYVYDADGQRLIRRDPAGTTLYVGGTELRLDASSGAVSATRYYTHNAATIAVRTAAGVRFLAADPHGTAETQVEAVSGALTRRRQLPFGGSREATAPLWAGERGFVGGTVDSSTGLTHLGAREYDPAAGRFTAGDPLIDPADPQQLNGYAYAGNNPTTMSDPDGLIPLGAGDAGMTPAQLYRHGGYYNADPDVAVPAAARRQLEQSVNKAMKQTPDPWGLGLYGKRTSPAVAVAI